VRRLDIQQSLNVLEELILSSPRIPLSRRTLVDEEQILEQLDRIRLNLPSVFQEAVQIVQQRNHILSDADRYAQELRSAADQEAAQRLDELGIVRQAETEAQYLKQQTQQDCEALKAQALEEIEQWQDAARQHWEQLRQQTEAECGTLRQDADRYAAQVLQTIETQLADMLRVVHNGRQALAPAVTPPALSSSPGLGSGSPKHQNNGANSGAGNGKESPRRREDTSKGNPKATAKALPQARTGARHEPKPRRSAG
jgi:F0F1-type ATP synthase membrane subunit b/b'